MMLEGDKTQLYKVLMACGHIEHRRMRPATAGIPWSPEAIVETPRAECKACRDSEFNARMLVTAQTAVTEIQTRMYQNVQQYRDRTQSEGWTITDCMEEQKRILKDVPPAIRFVKEGILREPENQKWKTLLLALEAVQAP